MVSMPLPWGKSQSKTMTKIPSSLNCVTSVGANMRVGVWPSCSSGSGWRNGVKSSAISSQVSVVEKALFLGKSTTGGNDRSC